MIYFFSYPTGKNFITIYFTACLTRRQHLLVKEKPNYDQGPQQILVLSNFSLPLEKQSVQCGSWSMLKKMGRKAKEAEALYNHHMSIKYFLGK